MWLLQHCSCVVNVATPFLSVVESKHGSYCAVSVWYMWQMPRYFWKVITAAALLFLLVNVATVLLFLVGKCGRGPLVSLVHVAAALLPVVEVKHGSCCVVSGW